MGAGALTRPAERSSAPGSHKEQLAPWRATLARPDEGVRAYAILGRNASGFSLHLLGGPADGTNYCSRRGGCPHPPGGAKLRTWVSHLGQLANWRATLARPDEGVRAYAILGAYVCQNGIRVSRTAQFLGSKGAAGCHNFSVTFYRRNLPHLQRDAKPHFITFVTKHRMVLPDWARDIVLNCCRHDDGIRYQLQAAVVMPDHAHLILTPGFDLARRIVVQLPEIMKAIKGASSHAINRHLDRAGAIWQEESFDHVLRSSEQLDAKILYLLSNPVRRGLVTDWQQYPWLWCREFVNRYAPEPPVLT